ncbi:MAG: MBL fold metallo-hydrolase [Nitrospira sp.]|nr:MBL fold metallo-hydrolase [Nitrospira sp.]
MPLEDDLCDILKKSRAGQGLSVSDLARMTGLPGGDITALERGDRPKDRAEVRALAKALGLRAEPLERIAIDKWEPVAQQMPFWVELVQGAINGYGVQGYILHDEDEAVLVDTAYNAPVMLDQLRRRGLRLLGICLTHGHADHADGIEQILDRYEVPVYLGPEDVELLGWRPRRELLVVPSDGLSVRVGRRTLRCMPTPGHTPGGICYCADDAQVPVCFVGDTLFAGSIGRSNPKELYPSHLSSVTHRVLTLSPDYRLLPGHGPATTVEEELEHNPFAALP